MSLTVTPSLIHDAPLQSNYWDSGHWFSQAEMLCRRFSGILIDEPAPILGTR